MKKIITTLSVLSLVYASINLVLLNSHDTDYIIDRAELCNKVYEMGIEEYKICAYEALGKIAKEENYGRLAFGVGMLLPLLYFGVPAIKQRLTRGKTNLFTSVNRHN